MYGHYIKPFLLKVRIYSSVPEQFRAEECSCTYNMYTISCSHDHLHVAQVRRVLQMIRSYVAMFDSSFNCDEVSIRFPVAPLVPVLQR